MKIKEKVPIKLSSELKHVAKNQEDQKDQQDDVALNVERYTWKTQHLKTNLVHGKFTKKEDEKLKKVIFYHIRVRFRLPLSLIDVWSTLLVSCVLFFSILSYELP